MFKKKDEKKTEEVKKEEVKILTLDDLEKVYTHSRNRSYEEVAQALHVLRDAIKFKQIRLNDQGKSLVGNEIGFGYAYSKEQMGIRYTTTDGYTQYRFESINAPDEVIFVDYTDVTKETKAYLQDKLNKLQQEQKKKVEEIEKLAKELGELENE